MRADVVETAFHVHRDGHSVPAALWRPAGRATGLVLVGAADERLVAYPAPEAVTGKCAFLAAGLT